MFISFTLFNKIPFLISFHVCYLDQFLIDQKAYIMFSISNHPGFISVLFCIYSKNNDQLSSETPDYSTISSY